MSIDVLYGDFYPVVQTKPTTLFYGIEKKMLHLEKLCFSKG